MNTDELFKPIEIREKKQPKIELYHDNLQNYKRYNIPPAQLVIAEKKSYFSSPFSISNLKASDLLGILFLN